MSQEAPWYRSNQVVWIFLMLPVVGFWVAYFVLSGSAQHVTRVASSLAFTGIILGIWTGRRSARDQR